MKTILLTLIAILLPCTIFAWQGKVIGISDGDTITVLREQDTTKEQVKIRLYGIDCPESHQAFGSAAKQATSDLVFGKIVEVDEIDKDRYGRTVAVVIALDTERVLNADLLAQGYAWVYRQYCREMFCDAWKRLESDARKDGRGLWADVNATPPWEFRRNGRQVKASIEESSVDVKQDLATVYRGNIDSKVFHAPQCKHYSCASCTITFVAREAAISAGYKPCGICKP